MSKIAIYTLVLPKSMHGKTWLLNGYQFDKDGCCVFRGDSTMAEKLHRHFSRGYQANLEEGDASKTQAHNAPDTDSQTNGTGYVEGDEGQEGILSSGDGYEDAGIPDEPGTARPREVRDAVLMLDPDNDEHWTSSGKPDMNAVQIFYGSAAVTRAAVDAAAPGFRRNNARKG